MATITDTKRRLGLKGGGADGKGSGNNDAPGGSRWRSMLTIVLAGIVLLGAGAAGTYFLFLKEPGPPPPPEPGAMVQMEPMTISLANKHFLKVQIAIELVQGEADPATFETIKASQLVIDTFSNLEREELTSNAARKDLTAQLLTGLQDTYPKEVYAVYLTQFVIQ